MRARQQGVYLIPRSAREFHLQGAYAHVEEKRYGLQVGRRELLDKREDLLGLRRALEGKVAQRGAGLETDRVDNIQQYGRNKKIS
jgi:hypothetical protein